MGNLLIRAGVLGILVPAAAAGLAYWRVSGDPQTDVVLALNGTSLVWGGICALLVICGVLLKRKAGGRDAVS